MDINMVLKNRWYAVERPCRLWNDSTTVVAHGHDAFQLGSCIVILAYQQLGLPMEGSCFNPTELQMYNQT